MLARVLLRLLDPLRGQWCWMEAKVAPCVAPLYGMQRRPGSRARISLLLATLEAIRVLRRRAAPAGLGVDESPGAGDTQGTKQAGVKQLGKSCGPVPADLGEGL
jgi:hypothetical protein